MILTYPDDCIQSLVASWWQDTGETTPCQWRLAWAFVPHVDQQPYLLVPKSRTDDREHDRVECDITPCNVSSPPLYSRLPVAALPTNPGESLTVYRAKKRPVIIVAGLGPEVPKEVKTGYPNRHFAPAYLCIPSYGVDQKTGKRAGYPPAFISRVKACEYPQFFWDKLPVPGADESILRLDQLQPVGGHYQSLEMTQFRLGEEAIPVMEEWLQWHFTGKIQEDGLIAFWLEMLGRHPSRA
jgi:hypothetical protein